MIDYSSGRPDILFQRRVTTEFHHLKNSFGLRVNYIHNEL